MFEHNKICLNRTHDGYSNQIIVDLVCNCGRHFSKKYAFTYHQKICEKSPYYDDIYAKDQHKKYVDSQKQAWSNPKLREEASKKSVFNNFWEYRTKNPIIYDSPIAGKIRLDSKWEEFVAKRLDELQVEWYRPKCRLPYFDFNGIEHSYIPDFYIKTYNCFIEVKSPFISKWQNSQNKVNYVKKYYPFVKWIESEEECKTFKLQDLHCNFIPEKKEEDISFWLQKTKKSSIKKVNLKIKKEYVKSDKKIKQLRVYNSCKNKKLEEERLKLLQESSIDLSKYGWTSKVAKLFGGISASKARKYIEKHFPEIAEKCYKRNIAEYH